MRRSRPKSSGSASTAAKLTRESSNSQKRSAGIPVLGADRGDCQQRALAGRAERCPQIRGEANAVRHSPAHEFQETKVVRVQRLPLLGARQGDRVAGQVGGAVAGGDRAEQAK